jgi:poly-gamma-glutamate synthesis protein (capsule biosynthesis protein)
MFSRGVRREILKSRDPAMPFRKIAPLLAASDIAFVNLESPFSDKGPYHEDGLIFHSPPEAIAGLLLAGVDVVSTANNHSRDCASHGVEFTVQWLSEHGILPVGSSYSAEQTHRGVVVERNGIGFGFLGYTYDQSNGNWHDIDGRVALADVETMRRDVRALRSRADVVIVSMHHGIEYMPKPSKGQVEFAHAAIDAGAKLVIGHHPHVIEPQERCSGGGLIVYSLGNFVFDQYQREQTQHGEIVQVSFLGRDILAVHVEPVRITPTGPELEGSSTFMDDRRLLDVAAELRTHSRKDFLGKGMLAP